MAAVAVLDRRSLNRALLARQLLLERSPMGPLQAIEHLVAMQAQLPTPPYYGLWTRLLTFAPEDLSQLFLDREVVRIALMRSTVHLVSAGDALALRGALQQVIGRGMTPGSPYGKALAGIDLTELAVLGRAMVEKSPLTGAEMGIALQARWPGVDVRALAFAVRALVPLVQVPPRGLWRGVGQARCTSAEMWLGGALAEPDVPSIIRRYLAAYGPASVRDAQAWSGLTGLAPVFESLRPLLLTFTDGADVELFDLPDAPRPAPDVPAPVRFLPDFDAILLSHQNRARMFDPDHKSLIFSSNGIIRSSVLIDGFVAALWTVRSDRDAATLVVTPLPSKGQEIIPAPVRRAVVKEGLKLLAWAHPGRSHDVLIGQPVRAWRAEQNL